MIALDVSLASSQTLLLHCSSESQWQSHQKHLTWLIVSIDSNAAGDQKLKNHENSDADNSSKDIYIIFWQINFPHVYFMSQESSFHVLGLW
jgi:hypothetical protein